MIGLSFGDFRLLEASKGKHITARVLSVLKIEYEEPA
jgi:hypothetical protein